MKIKPIVFVLLFFAPCLLFAQPLEERIAAEKCSWVEFYSNELEDFSLSHFNLNNTSSTTEEISLFFYDSLTNYDLNKDSYQQYYVVSPDSSMFIRTDDYLEFSTDAFGESVIEPGEGSDLYTCYLLNFNLNKKFILKQVGLGTWIEEALWLSEDTVLLLGGTQNNSCEKYLPIIWEIDLKTNRIVTYNYICTGKQEASWKYVKDHKFRKTCGTTKE